MRWLAPKRWAATAPMCCRPLSPPATPARAEPKIPTGRALPRSMTGCASWRLRPSWISIARSPTAWPSGPKQASDWWTRSPTPTPCATTRHCRRREATFCSGPVDWPRRVQNSRLRPRLRATRGKGHFSSHGRTPATASGVASSRPVSPRNDRLRRFEKADQLLAHDLWLLLLRPMASAIHQLHSSEFREARLAGCLRTPCDPIGAPVLDACDELRGDIDGPPREGELFGDVWGKRRAPMPIVVQSARPA